MLNLNRATISALLLSLTSILASCGTLRGEMVETGKAPQHRPGSELQEVDAGSSDTTKVTSPQGSNESFNFEAVELFSGATISGAELYSTGPIALTFVSPGCQVSVSHGSELAGAAEANDDITYVIVHTGGHPTSYLDYVEENDLYQQNVLHIDDTAHALWDRFQVEVTPSSVLVDREGSARFSTGALDHEGLRDAADLLRGVPNS